MENISESDYDSEQIKAVVATVKAMSRCSPNGIYILDFFRMNLLYVTENPSFMLGYSREELKSHGLNFFRQQCSKEDLEYLHNVDVIGTKFLEEKTPEEKMEYSISYDFHLINRHLGKKQLYTQQFTPILMQPNGLIWLALCVLTIPKKKRSYEVVFKKINSSEVLKYDMKNNIWIKKPQITLSDTERDILRLSIRGYSMKEIGEILCRSINTIKVYRKSLFEKLDVDNISEAINVALQSKLIT